MMTLLQFFLFEIMIILILKKINIQNNGMYFLILAYPIWLVYAFLFCLEIIPFHPKYPRFDGGFGGFYDIIILLIVWVVGMYLISFIMFLMNMLLNKISQKLIQKLMKVSMLFFIIFLVWGWVGFYSTPKTSNQIFIKPNPTFKVFFVTKYNGKTDAKIVDEILQLQNLDEQKEEFLFMQYVQHY